jgi:hypothetical protein
MSDKPSWRSMMYKAVTLAGRPAVLEPEVHPQTMKIVESPADQALAFSLGWRDTPGEAVALWHQQQDQISTDAVQRVKEDRRLSDAAQAEIAAYEQTTGMQHVVVVPPEAERDDAVTEDEMRKAWQVKRGPARPRKDSVQ